MVNKEKNYLSVVVLLGNCAAEALSCFAKINEFCLKYFANYELIFVNNNIPDTVLEAVKRTITNAAIQAHFVTLPYEMSLEQAMLAGIEAANGDYLLEIDSCDSDFSVDNLWEMYSACLKNNDFVFLSPEIKPSFAHRIFYKILQRYTNKHTIIKIGDIALLSRRAINRVNQLYSIIYYRKYAYYNAGLKYTHITYKPSKKYKKRKLTWQTFDFATTLLLLFTNIGKTISVFLVIIFSAFSLLMFLYALSAYFLLSHVVSGWTTLMLFLSVSFAGLFACLLIIIKYLNLLLVSSGNREKMVYEKRKI